MSSLSKKKPSATYLSVPDSITANLTHGAWLAEQIKPLFLSGMLPVKNVLDRTLTGIQAVYFILDTDGTLLYIGQSVNLWQRLDSHRRSEKFTGQDFGTYQVAYSEVTSKYWKEKACGQKP